MKRVNQERGASAVEFAIIASLLLLVVFATIQFGILLNRFQGLQASGREGARLGSLTQVTVGEIRTRVLDSVSIIASNNLDDFWCNSWPGSDETGCILIQTKQDNNDDGDTTDGGELTTWTSLTDKPCNSAPAQGRSIVVDVRFRPRLDIPFWNFGAMTMSGSGEFRCEGG